MIRGRDCRSEEAAGESYRIEKCADKQLIARPCHPSCFASTRGEPPLHHEEPETTQQHEPQGARRGRKTNLRLVLLRFLRLLVVLRLRDRRRACSSALRRGLVPACKDRAHVCADDPALVLDRLARALLRNLLRDALLVHAPVDLRPGDLARVLALQEEGRILRRGEAEDLARKREYISVSEVMVPPRCAPCCRHGRTACPCWGRCGSRRMSRFRPSTLKKREC
jgi:hypothetical protein